MRNNTLPIGKSKQNSLFFSLEFPYLCLMVEAKIIKLTGGREECQLTGRVPFWVMKIF